MKTLFKNCLVVSDNLSNKEVLVEDGIILQIENQIEEVVDEIIDCKGLTLFPGMIDIHLHGSYGYDFIQGPNDIVGRNLPKEGTTAYLASLTVVSHEETLKLLEEFDHFKTAPGSATFLGVHVEGPYLSQIKKALMDPRYLRSASQKEFDEMKKHSSFKVMTIAPEIEGCLKLIEDNHEDTIFMLGHTNCKEKEATEALKNGAKGFTHLYNAMSEHLHRDPGAVTAALNSTSFAELICDGNHVDKSVIQATYRTLSAKQIILITDAMLAKGMEDGDYLFSNLMCRKVKDRINVIENGIFAGSVITQNDAIKHMKEFTGCSLCELAQMAALNPARLLGVNKGSIEVGKDADFILLDENLDVQATYIAGKKVYEADSFKCH